MLCARLRCEFIAFQLSQAHITLEERTRARQFNMQYDTHTHTHTHTHRHTPPIACVSVLPPPPHSAPQPDTVQVGRVLLLTHVQGAAVALYFAPTGETDRQTYTDTYMRRLTNEHKRSTRTSEQIARCARTFSLVSACSASFSCSCRQSPLLKMLRCACRDCEKHVVSARVGARVKTYVNLCVFFCNACACCLFEGIHLNLELFNSSSIHHGALASRVSRARSAVNSGL